MTTTGGPQHPQHCGFRAVDQAVSRYTTPPDGDVRRDPSASHEPSAAVGPAPDRLLLRTAAPYREERCLRNAGSRLSRCLLSLTGVVTRVLLLAAGA